MGATVRETRTLTAGDHELVWTILEDPTGKASV
nr:hypothetical protein [Natronobiforma cellulositropha]